MRNDYVTPAVWLGLLLGCRAPATEHANAPAAPLEKAGTRVEESMPQTGADDSSTTDRLSDINPSPERDTIRGLLVLRGWVEAQRRETGRLPRSLEEILPPDSDNPIYRPHERWWHDGWQRRFLYEVANRSYEIRSAGADGITGNSDDYFVP